MEHRIKNWRRLLACSQSKNKLTEFLAESWKSENLRNKLCDKTMYIGYGEKRLKLTRNEWEEVEHLRCTHEEADTRLLLHAHHAAQCSASVVVVADDTDVMMICLGVNSSFSNAKLFLRRGTKSRVRIVDITKLSQSLGKEVSSALPGLHSWTGCDSVSSFAGHGKVKALKLLQVNAKFRDAFISIGDSWDLKPDVFEVVEEFTCQMYSKNTPTVHVNDLRYEIFSCKKGSVESGQLPPCRDTLLQHTLRSNYQAAIWKRSLENLPDIPEASSEHGWQIDDNGDLTIKWMTGMPAPQAVISLISCQCRCCDTGVCAVHPISPAY